MDKIYDVIILGAGPAGLPGQLRRFTDSFSGIFSAELWYFLCGRWLQEKEKCAILIHT